MRRSKYANLHAFTLLELMAAIVVMSIISVVLLPVLTSASESYTTTREVRARTEHMAFALDRIARMIRQAPIGADDSGVGIQTATANSVVFADGTGIELSSGQLELVVPGESNALLCDGVDSLSIQYFANDGITSTLATPTDTHRISVTLTSGQLTMSVVAHPRVWIGQGDGT